MKKILICGLITILMLNTVIFTVFGTSEINNEKNNAPRRNLRFASLPALPAFSISSDIEFNDTAEQYGWPGNGTQDFPYVISGYSFANTTQRVIDISNTNVYFEITDCLIDGLNYSITNHAGIYINDAANGKIFNNTIYNFKNGIEIWSSEYISITGNYIYNITRAGITVLFGSYMQVKFNICNDNIETGVYQAKGIGIEQGEYVEVRRNTVSHFMSDNAFGITLSSSDNCSLIANTITEIATNGISIGSSTHSRISSNTITNCDRGINSYSSSTNNNVFNNTISNNGKGLTLSNGVTANQIIGNRFVANTVNVQDDGTANIYDFNYWDDWITPDSNNDGLVDTPYTVRNLAGSASGVDNNPTTTAIWNPQVEHDSIAIDGNDAFKAQALAEHWEGDGSSDDPFIIESFLISNDTGYPISIKNVDIHFIIRNCIINGVNKSINDHKGIYLWKVSNGALIENCEVTNVDIGISMVCISRSYSISI